MAAPRTGAKIARPSDRCFVEAGPQWSTGRRRVRGVPEKAHPHHFGKFPLFATKKSPRQSRLLGLWEKLLPQLRLLCWAAEVSGDGVPPRRPHWITNNYRIRRMQPATFVAGTHCMRPRRESFGMGLFETSESWKSPVSYYRCKQPFERVPKSLCPSLLYRLGRRLYSGKPSNA